MLNAPPVLVNNAADDALAHPTDDTFNAYFSALQRHLRALAPPPRNYNVESIYPLLKTRGMPEFLLREVKDYFAAGDVVMALLNGEYPLWNAFGVYREVMARHITIGVSRYNDVLKYVITSYLKKIEGGYAYAFGAYSNFSCLFSNFIYGLDGTHYPALGRLIHLYREGFFKTPDEVVACFSEKYDPNSLQSEFEGNLGFITSGSCNVTASKFPDLGSPAGYQALLEQYLIAIYQEQDCLVAQVRTPAYNVVNMANAFPDDKIILLCAAYDNHNDRPAFPKRGDLELAKFVLSECKDSYDELVNRDDTTRLALNSAFDAMCFIEAIVEAVTNVTSSTVTARPLTLF